MADGHAVRVAIAWGLVAASAALLWLSLTGGGSGVAGVDATAWAGLVWFALAGFVAAWAVLFVWARPAPGAFR